MDTERTIVAVSSPPGHSWRGIVRVSGPRAFESLSRFFRPFFSDVWGRGYPPLQPSPTRWEETPSFRQSFRTLSGRIQTSDSFHPCSVYLMRAPYSYTGEDMAEIHMMGHPFLLQDVVDNFLSCGVEGAKPGEFTRRAYENCRIRLDQAEAVAALIASTSEKRRSLLSRHLYFDEGTQKNLRIQEQLFSLLTHVEASIDFIEQGIELLSSSQIERQLAAVVQEVRTLCQEGLEWSSLLSQASPSLAFWGLSNVGKTSLFNRLVPNRKNVVSTLPGATRDFVEAEGRLGDTGVTFMDLPGWARGAESDRALAEKALESVLVRVLVLDGSLPWSREEEDFLNRFSASSSLWIVNKMDRLYEGKIEALEGFYQKMFFNPTLPLVKVSALTGLGMGTLKKCLVRLIRQTSQEPSESAYLVTSVQKEGLFQALSLLEEGIQTWQKESALDLLSFSLRSALTALKGMNHRAYSEALLERVFERFCIGK